MKLNIFNVILALFVCSKSYGQIHEDSIVIWDKNNKLKWDYFKGLPLKKSGDSVALSFVEIGSVNCWDNDDNLPNYKMYAFLKKYDSWSKDTSQCTLLHEQLHFDIGELYARKMRKAIYELRQNYVDSVNDYFDVLNKLYIECKEVNYLYDKETANGIYSKRQQEWNKKISKELFQLKEYEVDYTSYLKCE
jgi:hypothetical protein